MTQRAGSSKSAIEELEPPFVTQSSRVAYSKIANYESGQSRISITKLYTEAFKAVLTTF